MTRRELALEFEEEPPRRPGPRRLPNVIRVGAARVHADTPSHTPGTRKGEELVQQSPEKGRSGGTARRARSSTSINAHLREPIDPRMPHLPPA